MRAGLLPRQPRQIRFYPLSAARVGELMAATEQGLARAMWEGLRTRRVPPDSPRIGQVRFGFT